MRTNRHGIRHLKSRQSASSQIVYYYWNPPARVRLSKIFNVVSLGTDFALAVKKTRALNAQLEKYIAQVFGEKPKLGAIKPLTTAWLARKFEASLRFSRYAYETRKSYSRSFRRIEIYMLDGETIFGELLASEVSHQMAYRIYEDHSSSRSGFGNGNKITDAWHAAFKYAAHAMPEIHPNPFAGLEKHYPPARRQRWTDEQLASFIEAAESQGHYIVGLYALLCMELAQRPCDVLNLKWADYLEDHGYFRVRQTKQHVEVRVPPTKRLRTALNIAKRRAGKSQIGCISNQFICPTVTGKRWHRRNIARLVRTIARSIGLPEELQIRDLRRTAATEAASAGATVWEMMSAGGWQNPASIQPYLVWTPEQAASFQAKREAYRARKQTNLKTGISAHRAPKDG